MEILVSCSVENWTLEITYARVNEKGAFADLES